MTGLSSTLTCASASARWRSTLSSRAALASSLASLNGWVASTKPFACVTIFQASAMPSWMAQASMFSTYFAGASVTVCRNAALVLVVVTGCADHPAAILLRHVERAVEQVAQAAGELLVIGHRDAFLAEIGIVAGGDVAHQVVAQSVGREGVRQRAGIDHVAECSCSSCDPFTFHQPWTTSRGICSSVKPERVQHDRPVDRVRRHQDVLADDVRVRGPEPARNRAGSLLPTSFAR